MAKNATAAPLLDTDQSPVRDMALVPKAESDSLVLMFERLATNPAVDVEKLERLIQMQERIMDRNARAAFDAAFAEMQSEIPEISEKGEILSRSGGVQSTYARNEDIQRALRPILKKFGFALSFRTEWPDEKHVRIVGILSHRDGHSRESQFLSQADNSGSKNDVQALGSAVSYGHRYTTKDLLNITSRGEDDDAEGSAPKKAPEAPAGYQDWLDDLTAAADEGWEAFKGAWNPDTVAPFREHLARTDAKRGELLKARAQKVTKDQKAARP